MHETEVCWACSGAQVIAYEDLESHQVSNKPCYACEKPNFRQIDLEDHLKALKAAVEAIEKQVELYKRS